MRMVVARRWGALSAPGLCTSNELLGTAATAAMVLPWVPAVAFTLAPSLGGFLSSRYALGEGLRWYASLQKPWWHPPHWTLGPIWGTLYSAMGYGSYMIWKELGGFSEEALVPLGLYIGQLALNWAWPPIFFGARQMGWALVDLLLTGGMAAATAVAWQDVSPPAARLLYPYLVWLAFAATLNYRVWRDNQGQRSSRRLAE
uniref:Translocator protein n=1 Tax=Equus caballus TaxID=9796 RepID=A0A9L0SPY4_HORSE